MAKQLKINIKNTQIAKAVHLGHVKEKIANKVESTSEPLPPSVKKANTSSSGKESSPSMIPPSSAAEEAPRIKARSKSVFEGSTPTEAKAQPLPQATHLPPSESTPLTIQEEAKQVKIQAAKRKEGEERRSALFAQEIEAQEKRTPQLESTSASLKDGFEPPPNAPLTPLPSRSPEPFKETVLPSAYSKEVISSAALEKPISRETLKPTHPRKESVLPSSTPTPPPTRLGPTGRHIKDLLPPKRPPQSSPPVSSIRQEGRFRPEERRERPDFRGRSSFAPGPGSEGNRPQGERAPFSSPRPPLRSSERPQGPSPFPRDRATRPAPRLRPLPPAPLADLEKQRLKPRVKPHEGPTSSPAGAADKKPLRTGVKGREVKPVKREEQRGFDARDRQGLRSVEEEGAAWRKRRAAKHRFASTEETTIRPTSLKIRLPISIKDLAVEMKLKASQLIQKLFMQNVIVTLNDLLEDETTVQLLGHEFGCDITIDIAEEQRLRITDKSVVEEIALTPPEELIVRPPVVAFMGHVDHGKTSLIDAIRKSNRVAGEAGAITQHIGAFRCHTAVGDLAILDTPGHEAFFAMRARGADVTDIVVLVVAGDEGIKQQTLEAIQHAKGANVTLVVAINKCDKPNFNAENIYRQLAEQDLLPEVWGGQIITVNCSATTGEGIPQLLEMLALQSEVLELRASPHSRARGRVLESEMHKGMGAVATVLVQNGTLRLGDALVFATHWGRIKTMRDEHGQDLKEAGPSTPVAVTGVSGLPEAGEEFIVVKSEREARAIAEDRQTAELRQHGLRALQKKKVSMENLLQQASVTAKKTLRLILRADVQGSLEAMKTALQKIHSEKVELDIIYAGIGEISESDAQRAAASKAVILGFHTAVESHADPLLRQLGVSVRLHDIIYHAIDDVKALMVQLLDKIAIETERGKAEVRATFKSSQVGVIAGCQVIEGSIMRNHQMRVRRGKEILWSGSIQSLKRVKEDVREVQKGIECGILLNGFSAFEVGDILEAYEITYITQQL